MSGLMMKETVDVGIKTENDVEVWRQTAGHDLSFVVSNMKTIEKDAACMEEAMKETVVIELMIIAKKHLKVLTYLWYSVC